MNGRELSKASLVDCPLSSEETPQLSDDEQLKSWAAIVAGCLQPVPFVPPSALGFGLSDAVAPEGWRPSVVALTPGEASTVVANGQGAPLSNPKTGTVDELNRIQLRVNTKECGEVALVVERADDGLRVLISAVDANAVKALHREAAVMRRALESGGQSVASLKIVRMDQRGTELAGDGLTPRQDRRNAKKATGAASKSRAAQRTSRRLIIIG